MPVKSSITTPPRRPGRTRLVCYDDPHCLVVLLNEDDEGMVVYSESASYSVGDLRTGWDVDHRPFDGRVELENA